MSNAFSLQRLASGLQNLARRPELRAGATSGVIMGVGDIVCQTLQKSSHNPKTKSAPLKRQSLAPLEMDPNNRQALPLKTANEPDNQKSGSLGARVSGLVEGLDFERTLRFALVGLTLHGPYFWHGFRWLDARFGPSKSLQIALAKTALGQAVVFPVYLSAFFVYMGKLEGKTWQECRVKLEQGFRPTYTSGCVFWPVANMFNFTMVPPTERVLYSNLVGLIWNSYLSYANSKVAKLPPLRPEQKINGSLQT